MAVEKDLLDQLLSGSDPKDMSGRDDRVDELKKTLSERVLDAEIDEYLDAETVEDTGNDYSNGLTDILYQAE